MDISPNPKAFQDSHWSVSFIPELHSATHGLLHLPFPQMTFFKRQGQINELMVIDSTLGEKFACNYVLFLFLNVDKKLLDRNRYENANK